MAFQGQSQKQWQIGDDLPLVIFEVQQKPWVHTYQEGDTLPQPCKHPGCKHKADAWRTLFLHVKNKHGLKIADYAGSYFHEAAKQAINSKMNGWRVEKGGWNKMSARAKKAPADKSDKIKRSPKPDAKEKVKKRSQKKDRKDKKQRRTNAKE